MFTNYYSNKNILKQDFSDKYWNYLKETGISCGFEIIFNEIV
jgi:hypothetical protein